MKVPLVPFNVPDYVQTQPTDASAATAGRFHVCYSLAELEPEVLGHLSETFRRDLFAKAGKVDPREELKFQSFKEQIQQDIGFAWSWHCNIAMAAQDVGVTHEVANRAAARFMSVCFDVDVTQFGAWKNFIWA